MSGIEKIIFHHRFPDSASLVLEEVTKRSEDRAFLLTQLKKYLIFPISIGDALKIVTNILLNQFFLGYIEYMAELASSMQ